MESLSLERRTGVKVGEIDDFLSKVDAVRSAIQGMKDGTVDPNTVRVPGILTEEERAQKEAKRKEAEEALEKRKAQRAIEQKREEKERWWRGAELLCGPRGGKGKGEKQGDDVNTSRAPISSPSVAEGVSARLMERYSLEYSRWDTWEPDDPATQEEHSLQQEQEERIKNEEFERANPEFCKSFVEDMQKRRETQEQKESAAKKHKMKGNRLFQARRYKDALDEYMTSLRDSPYLAATLGNVAMAHIKLEQWDDAIEFCDRCLHVDDTFVKAYSRRATARIALGLPMEAETDLKDALKLCPENEDLQRQYDVLKTDIADTKIEKELVEKPDFAASCQAVERLIDESVAHGKESLPASLLLSAFLSDSPHMLAHIRSRGGLLRILAGAKEGSPHLLQPLSVAAALDQKSRVILWYEGGVTAAELVLRDAGALHENRFCAAKLVKACLECEDQRFHALSKPPHGGGIYAALLQYAADPASSAEGVRLAAESVQLACSGKTSKLPGLPCAQGPLAASISSLGICLSRRVHGGLSEAASVAACTALASLAAFSAVRTLFLGGEMKSEVVAANSSAIEALLAVARSPKCTREETGLALAAVFNACFTEGDEPLTVCGAVHDCGGTALMLAILAVPNDKAGSPGVLVQTRAAKLLGRLAHYPPALKVLSTPGALRMMAKLLSKAECRLEGDRTFAEQVTRIISAVLRSSASEEMMEVSEKEMLCANIVSLLPPARCDSISRRVTRETVILRTEVAISVNLAGNACGALLHLLNDANGPLAKQAISCGAIERIISLFSNCTHTTVRKNASICLAKLARNAEYKARITELRGMEMLMAAGGNGSI